MSEPILNPSYWSQRLAEAPSDQPWKAIYDCGKEEWLRCEREHRRVLRLIEGNDSVLDVGCAWGRLLDLMPRGWHGDYLGIDHSEDFILRARVAHPDMVFLCCDVRSLLERPEVCGKHWDWAVLLSFEAMFKKHLGPASWPPVERIIRQVADNLLVLDFTRGWKAVAYRDEWEDA